MNAVTATTADAVTADQGYNVLDYIDAEQLAKDVTYSVNDLTGAMMQQSSMFVHYGQLAAKASRQVDVVKMLLENTEAAVYQAIRTRAISAQEKFTESFLEKEVARHPRVTAMKRSLVEAKRIEATAKIAVEGFRHRRDMLVQQGLISREEMKGELYLSTRSQADEAREHMEKRLLDRMNPNRSE